MSDLIFNPYSFNQLVKVIVICCEQKQIDHFAGRDVNGRMCFCYERELCPLSCSCVVGLVLNKESKWQQTFIYLCTFRMVNTGLLQQINLMWPCIAVLAVAKNLN